VRSNAARALRLLQLERLGTLLAIAGAMTLQMGLQMRTSTMLDA
jgi:hypothetical protein